MVIAVDEDRRVRGVTLALAALATVSTELAIAEPGRPPGLSLALAAGWFLAALMLYLWTAQPAPACDVGTGRRSPTRPLVVVGLLIGFAAPFAIEAGRLAWSGRTETLEIVLLSALRNLGLGLAVLARRPAFARLAALVSLFLVLVASSLSEGTAVLGTLGLYAVVGGLWLTLTYWRGIRLPSAIDGRRHLPIAMLALSLGLVGLVVAFAAVGPARAVAALAGFMPSSGGTSWDNPDARGGVNDGENEVKGSDKPESIGFTESDVYLDSDRPSLYDAFSDLYGEPIKPKQRDRVVAINDINQVVEQKDRPSENLRAGRQFSAVRKGNDRPSRKPGDREAKALLYVKGPTPLHLGLAAYDRFDGREWKEESESELDRPLAMESTVTPWFRIDSTVPALFAEPVSHKIKIGALDSSPLPVPPFLSRFRVGQVNRRDFFGWSHEAMVRMVGRTVPSSTVVETEARTIDPGRLRALTFPTQPYGAKRLRGQVENRAIDPEVAALARSWAAGTDRGWGQVETVVATLRRHAEHDRRGVAPPDCDDVAAHFLLRSRRGPDYLFATSAAVLLRSLGYPTRLVSGLYAAPERYDARTKHTPVTTEDVHVWAEVRLPNGTWVPVEPTPGYEMMGPALSWSERLRAASAAALLWARSRAASLALCAVALALVARYRLHLADLLATLAWRAGSSSDPRRRAVGALRLVERRARWAGLTRPPGRTPRRWYGAIASSTGCGDTLDGLVRMAEWSLYAPPALILPDPLAPDDLRDACHRAVDVWTLRRFRASARPLLQKELAT